MRWTSATERTFAVGPWVTVDELLELCRAGGAWLAADRDRAARQRRVRAARLRGRRKGYG